MTISKVIRGIRDTIPAGYILGRAPGIAAGKAQLISPSDLADKIIATGKVYSPANPPPAPAATGGGLFSQVLSAVPTQTSTGLTTWLNQNSGSVVNGKTGLSIIGPYNNSENNLSALGANAPSTPYGVSILACCNPYYSGSNSGNGTGQVGFSDGTKAIGFDFSADTSSLVIATYSKFQNGTGTAVVSKTFVSQCFWLGLSDDGTDIYFTTSMDGVNWSLFYSEARTSYLANVDTLFFSYNGFTAQGSATILSWAIQNSILPP